MVISLVYLRVITIMMISSWIIKDFSLVMVGRQVMVVMVLLNST